MKQRTFTIIVIAAMAATTTVFAGNGYGGGVLGATGCGQVVSQYLASLPFDQPDEAEVASLIHMRQEEKLARDVYLTLQLQWGAPVFANIARSEQQHMDMVELLLDTYGIDDPAADDTIGTYASEEFEALYAQLVEAGSSSYDAALTVGATIEDLDIFDLEEALYDEADNADIRMVYQNLLKGSRNHMRAFLGQLSTLGIAYTAQYIGQEELEEIVSSDSERGLILDENGDVLAACGNAGNGTARGGLRRGGNGQGGGNGPGTPGAGAGGGVCDGSGPGV